MNKVIFLLLLTFTCHSGFSQDKLDILLKDHKHWVADTTCSMFMVKKIKRIKGAILIEIMDVDSEQSYRVISLKKKTKNGIRFKTNRIYKMKIWPSSPVVLLNAHGIIKIQNIDGHKIKIKSHIDYPREYLSSNTHGIYYIPCIKENQKSKSQ